MSETAQSFEVVPVVGSGEASDWSLKCGEGTGWLSVLRVSRKGVGPEALAELDLEAEEGSLYSISVLASAVVGKLQVLVDDKAVLTADADGYFRSRFRAKSEKPKLSLKCVARSDASAIVTELIIEKV